MLSIELIVRSNQAKTRNINSNIFLPFRHIFGRRRTLIFDFWNEAPIFCVFMQKRYGSLGTTTQVVKT